MHLQPVTPNRFKSAQKELRTFEREYAAARKAALEVGRHYRAHPTGRNALAREDAIGAALDARRWVREQRRRVWDFAGRVELGARWSKRGLENVQRANRNR